MMERLKDFLTDWEGLVAKFTATAANAEETFAALALVDPEHFKTLPQMQGKCVYWLRESGPCWVAKFEIDGEIFLWMLRTMQARRAALLGKAEAGWSDRETREFCTLDLPLGRRAVDLTVEGVAGAYIAWRAALAGERA